MAGRAQVQRWCTCYHWNTCTLHVNPALPAVLARAWRCGGYAAQGTPRQAFSDVENLSARTVVCEQRRREWAAAVTPHGPTPCRGPVRRAYWTAWASPTIRFCLPRRVLRCPLPTAAGLTPTAAGRWSPSGCCRPAGNAVREKGTGTFCAKHPQGRSGKRCLSPFPDARLEMDARGYLLGPALPRSRWGTAKGPR